jgi:hypothetical protein
LRRMANTILALKDAKPQMFEMIRSHLEQSQWQEFIAGDLAEANMLENVSISSKDLKLPSQNVDDDDDVMFFNGKGLYGGKMHEDVGTKIR